MPAPARKRAPGKWAHGAGLKGAYGKRILPQIPDIPHTVPLTLPQIRPNRRTTCACTPPFPTPIPTQSTRPTMSSHPLLDLGLYALAALSALGVLMMLIGAVLPRQPSRTSSRPPHRPPHRTPRGTPPRKLRPRPARPILIDGSNVVMWQKNAGLATGPDLTTLTEVLTQVEAEGRAPHVIFDATIGYWLQDRFMHEGELRQLLGRPNLDMTVVQKGTTADLALLAEAARTGAPIITNDRYRDHPKPHGLHLRMGHFTKGRIRLRATG